jgi:hypothetical protein
MSWLLPLLLLLILVAIAVYMYSANPASAPRVRFSDIQYVREFDEYSWEDYTVPFM